MVSLAGVEGDYVLLEGGVGGEAAGALGAPEIACNCVIVRFILFDYMCLSVCSTRCNFRLVLRMSLPHLGHGSLWFRSCSTKSSRDENTSSHLSHLYTGEPLWVDWCSRCSRHVLNRFEHISQM